MAKVTVRDVFNTRRNLVRFENYAYRHMDNLLISEANENVAKARALLKNNVDAFDDCDVAALTRDTTNTQEAIQRAKKNRDYWKDRLRHEENELASLNEQVKDLDEHDEEYDDNRAELESDMEWRTENVEYAKTEVKDCKRTIKKLKKEL